MKRILIILISLFLFSCADPASDNNNTTQKSYTIIYKDIIKRASNDSLMQGVTVKWMDNGTEKSTVSNTYGVAIINDIKVGTYELTYEVDGFVKMKRTLVIDTNSFYQHRYLENNNGHITDEYTYYTDMYKSVKGVSTTFYKFENRYGSLI